MALTIKQFAEAFIVTEQHVRNMIARGDLPSFNLGRAVRIPIFCPNCGATDSLAIKLGHAGGTPGTVPMLQCQDERACWETWDASNLIGKSA